MKVLEELQASWPCDAGAPPTFTNLNGMLCADVRGVYGRVLASITGTGVAAGVKAARDAEVALAKLLVPTGKTKRRMQ